MSSSPLVEPARFVADLPALAQRSGPALHRFLAASAEIVSVGPATAHLALSGSAGTAAGTPDGGPTLTVEAVTDGVIRVKVAGSPGAVTRSRAAWTLVDPERRPQDRLTVRQVPDGLVVDAGSLRAELTTDPLSLRFLDGDGRVVVEQSRGDADATGTLRALPMGVTETGEGTVFHDLLRVRPDERLYGLGESFTPLDKRGRHAMIWTVDAYGTGSERSYKPVPMVISTAGYGLVVDSGLPVELDLAGSSDAGLAMLAPDDALDYYVVAGPSPAEILARVRRLTGPVRLPPRWAFGGWMSTGFLPQTQESVLACAEQLAGTGFPCDVLHIDPYWMRFGTWSDLAWDTEAFPDPKAMLTRLAELGLRVCLWINPYIGTDSAQFAHGDRRGYFLKNTDGSTWTGQIWGDDVPHPPVAIVDFTHVEARQWFQERLRAVLDVGVEVFKTDFGEGVPPGIVAANGLTGLELHNVYPLLYNEAVADATEQVRGHRTVWGRSSYLGGQRHAAQWGGDTPATWDGMASTLRGGLSYALSGYSFWSHDVGGFSGQPTGELFARWAQWGALSPMTRLHGTSSRIPWEWDDDTHRRVRSSIDHRYRLMPYLWSQAVRSAAAGQPLMRPLVHEAPDDPATWDVDSCYLLGEDLLVAPVRDADGTQLAYLPEGTWIEHDSGESWTGRQWVRRRLTDDRLPVFVRAGAVLATTPGLRRVPDGPFGDVVLEVWGEHDTSHRIEDVDGSTDVRVSFENGTVRIDLAGPLDVSRIEIRGVAGGLSGCVVDGAPHPVRGSGGSRTIDLGNGEPTG